MISHRTRIGNVGSRLHASVDSRGRVTPWPDGWSLDWWIMADDGWHVASEERGSKMSQRLVDATPVVETTMRIPGGEVRHRAYAIAGVDEFVAVEITNQSPVPIAVGLAVEAGIDSDIELCDQTKVAVDGDVALLLPKPPPRREQAAFVYPLPHTTSIRALLPLAASSRIPSVPTTVPTVEQVTGGWQAHARRGLRVSLPDPRVQAAVDANRLTLLLVDGRDDPTVSVALDRYGLNGEPTPMTAAGVAGATQIVRDRRRKLKRRHPAPAAAGDDLVDLAGLRAAAELLHAAGESRAAAQATSEADRLWIDLIRDRRALDLLRSVIDAASPTWSWSDERTGAAVLLFLRDLLVREAAAGIDLLTLVPDDWLGQGIEVHDAPTHHGCLSYAVRWHGERPALLWERTTGSDTAVTLRAPGLDPSWATAEPSGEALLAPVEPPKVTVT